jgi:hypothetical protein
VSAMFQLGKTFLMSLAIFADTENARSPTDTARNILWNVTRLYAAAPDRRIEFQFNQIELMTSLAIAESLAGNEQGSSEIVHSLLANMGELPTSGYAYFDAELGADFLAVAVLLLREREFAQAERWRASSGKDWRQSAQSICCCRGRCCWKGSPLRLKARKVRGWN